MQVDHRCFDTGMLHVALDGGNIGTGFEQMRCERMAIAMFLIRMMRRSESMSRLSSDSESAECSTGDMGEVGKLAVARIVSRASVRWSDSKDLA